ncbi:hypothetical protein KKH39_04370 [Patescibacteria group bacterium]|nr:hypothetical protein [Patescibacteria group bacterium]
MIKLKEKIKKFPDSPGVYHWLDDKGHILYVGRAASLKKRVAQYFRKDIENRIAEMVNLASDIEYQKTDSILDSVVLEANDIKKYWPKYNVIQRDDKSFLYLVIAKTDYPHPILIRGRDLKKFPQGSVRVFGPYQAAALLNNALKIIRRIFPYSKCRPDQTRPCFDHQIGLCPGVCVGKISKKDYQKNINNIILLLSGQKTRLMAKLAKENPEQANSLRHLQDVSLLTNEDSVLGGINRIEGYDISHFSGKETYASMVVFSAGVADKNQYRLFKIKNSPANDDLRSLEEALLRRLTHKEWTRPDLMMIDGGRPQIDYVDKVFKAQNINIPIVGISKFSGDKLVYPKGTKKEFKEMTENIKNTLLKVREEAHRFALSAGRRRRNKY